MRTTVTLDPDVAQLVRRRMRERSQTFKQALNDLIRASAEAPAAEPFRTGTRSLGVPKVSLDRALQLAADLEDEDRIAQLRGRS